MKLAIKIKPYPDELLYSYYLRVALSNALSYEELQYLSRSRWSRTTYKKRLDSLYDLPHFFELASVDALETYFNHSIYPALQYFLKKIPRMIYAGASLLDFTDFPKLWQRRFPKFITMLKVCPACQKEDLQTYGKSYLHRSHHVGDVKVCFRHKNPLYELKNNLDPALIPGKELVVENLHDELRFAEFIYLLFHPFSLERQAWIQALEDDSCNKWLQDYADRIVSNAFQNQEKDIETIRKELLSALTQENAPRVSEQAGGFKTYRCYECGENYISKAELINMGYGCPCERQRKIEVDIIEEIIKAHYHGRFTLLYQHVFAKSIYLLLFDHLVGRLLILRPLSLFFTSLDHVYYFSTHSTSNSHNSLHHHDLEQLDFSIAFEEDHYITTCKTCGSKARKRIRETYIEHCFGCEKEKMMRLYQETEVDHNLNPQDVLLPNARRLSNRVKVYEEIKKELEGFVEPLSLVLTKDSQSNKIYIKHDRCGHITVKTRSTYIPEQYFHCRGCNSAIYRKDALKVLEKGLLDRAQHVLEDFGGRLSVHRVVDSLKKIVEIKHEECRHIKRLNYGALSDIKARQSSVCKVCKNSVLSDSLYKENRVVCEEVIKAFSHELILENPGRINLGKIELRHTECGGVFPRTITVLSKNKSVLCPVCHKNILRKDPISL